MSAHGPRGVRRLLAFDAAGAGCSAAVWREGRIVARRSEAMQRGQAERLLPLIEETMAEAGLDYAELDAIAVTTGPGGFTGVRIGLATARGLALACRKPLLGVTCFEAVAAAVPAAERVGRLLVVVLESKRADVYVQAFDADLCPVGEAMARLPEALHATLPSGPLLLAGDAVERSRPALLAAGRDVRLARAARRVDAASVAELAAVRPLPAAGAPPPRPLYLRPPDVTPLRDGAGASGRSTA